MRNFDIHQQFEDIKQAAAAAIRRVFPVVGRRRTLELAGVAIDDALDAHDYADQAKAKNKEGTWGVNVYADLVLKDNATGHVLDQARKVKLFTLPKLTARMSYIVKGNEYQVSNQLRLKSGVYTLRGQNGKLKTQVNLAKGRNFDLVFDEEAGIFYMTNIAGKSAKIRLYPVLTYLGVSPGMIEKAWGTELARVNQTSDQREVARAAQAFDLRQGRELKDYLAQTKLGEEATELVLGKAFSKVDGQMLLAASQHLYQVHTGKKAPVDRDSLVFKELHSVEDFIGERLEKNTDKLAYKIQRGLNNERRLKISQIVNPGAFNSTVESFFTQDDKSATPEQTNPLEMLTGHYEATIMGAGGIGSEHMVTPEMRQIHPTHYGFLDAVHTPESKKIGANLHLPIGVVKDGKALKATVLDRDGKIAHLTPKEAWEKKVAFPGQDGDTVDALWRGKTVRIKRSEADYFTPKPSALFSWSTNLIPYLASNQGNRAMMASKQLEQAISLKHPEAPLVQIGATPTATMEELIGGEVAVKAPDDGVVKKVAPDHVVLKTADGDKKLNLYNNFTLNRKSFLHHTPKVKVGDKVKKGDLIADSNFTKDGTLALGTNMRVAYIPYKGLNFEDGVVITDSAADKLTSEHVHKKAIDLDPTVQLSLTKFRFTYPNVLTPENARALDDDGVIKKGAKVRQGTVLVAALKARNPNQTVAVINKALSERPKNISLTWGFEDEGTVMDVQKRSDKVIVYVKTEERARIGDKIAGRNGNKGIITKIIPDKEAPKDKHGRPVEMLLNPHGVISRINIGQIFESAAGKAALVGGGKPHVVHNFSGENYLDTTKRLLAKAGVPDKEELFDPETGHSLGRVHVGNPYILKLYKQGTHNFSVRQGGSGHPYDANRQPLKAGGDEGAKSLDVLTMNAMLAHGARANLREMATYKSDQNEEFWRAIKVGLPVPPPKQTFAYTKFMNYLKAAGVDVQKNGTELSLGPLTDKQVGELSALEIKNPQFFRAKDFQPVKGGFLDQQRLGGFHGERWGHIELAHPVVNPVFEDAVKKITGLGRKFDDIMAGKLFLDKKTGNLNTEGKGLTSGEAIEHLLKEIDVKAEIKKLKAQARGATASKLDDINKRLKILSNLDRLELRPHEAYIRRKVPVIPPQFRPLYPLPDGNVTTSDVNVLYHNTGVLNYAAQLPVMKLLPETEKAEVRKELYDHVKAVSGLLDLNVKGRTREGFISEIKGGSDGQPKEGFFISKLLSKKQDQVGRGTIIPEPDLGVDEMAMPEEMAWKLFEPFLIRELKNHGKTPLDAADEVKKKTRLARAALDRVMKERHVLLNRAPSLHKFSIMAFKPKITTGRALKIPPLVVKGFNADFDGDTMTVHVPITQEANREAERMLPSRNLFQPGTGKILMSPNWEAQTGIFYLSQTEKGRARLNAILGPKYKISQVMTKGATTRLLTQMAKEMRSDDFARTLQGLKAAGEQHAYERGFTLGVSDLHSLGAERDKIVSAAQAALTKAKTPEEVQAIARAGTKKIDELIAKKLAGTNNPLYDMVASGARGEPSQLRQIVATPLFVTDARGKVVPRAIKRSYAEGLPISDYWTSMYGARRGMMDRAIQTSEPGAFSKEISNTTLDNVITAVDCGTKEGITVRITDPDAVGRYLAHDQYGYPRNTPVDHQLVQALQKKGTEKIEVRSPLTCHQSRGTCAKCFGHDEHGGLPALGDNIGAKAGQTISEPLVQMVMNTFHTGGAAGTGRDVGGYARVGQLLRMPEELAGAAPLAPVAGKVTKVERGVGGGFNVYVGDHKVYVPAGRSLKVKAGDQLGRGDALSDGPIRPQDLVRTKGMRATQDYLVDQLHQTYKNQGVTLERKMFETVVRSLGNFTKVLNSPKDAPHLPGDIIPYTVAEHYNRNLAFTAKPEDAVGHELGADYGTLKKGHVLTEKDAKLLKAQGHNELQLRREALEHAPLIKGMRSVPLLRQDWMAALGFQNLAKAITEGAAQGWKTDVAGTHPVPAFAHGATFGQGKDGKY